MNGIYGNSISESLLPQKEIMNISAPVKIGKEITLDLSVPNLVTIPGYTDRINQLKTAKIIPPLSVLIHTFPTDDRKGYEESSNKGFRQPYIDGIIAHQ